MRTIRANPPLLRQLWQFVESPTLLDPVQLQYWCRCAGGLLLSDDGATPSGSEPPPGVGTLLRHLLRHLHSDAVAVLLKCLLSVLAVPGCASWLTRLAGPRRGGSPAGRICSRGLWRICSRGLWGRRCDAATWIRPPPPSALRPPPSALRPPPSALGPPQSALRPPPSPPTRPDRPTAPAHSALHTPAPARQRRNIPPSTGVAARCRSAPCWRRCCPSPPSCCSIRPSVPTTRPTCCARCATRSRTTRTRPRCSRPSSRASRRSCAAPSASACRYVALPSSAPAPAPAPSAVTAAIPVLEAATLTRTPVAAVVGGGAAAAAAAVAAAAAAEAVAAASRVRRASWAAPKARQVFPLLSGGRRRHYPRSRRGHHRRPAGRTAAATSASGARRRRRRRVRPTRSLPCRWCAPRTRARHVGTGTHTRHANDARHARTPPAHATRLASAAGVRVARARAGLQADGWRRR